MAHQRDRQILPLLLKRMKLWPVIGLIGARQTGKSVLLRDLLGPKVDAKYLTLDSMTVRNRAISSPESFSEPLAANKTLILDEVQKAPDLFDAVKLHVDHNRRPAMYILSGSTEFSKMTGIRESLTGRIGILRLYPLSISEIERGNFGHYFIKKMETTSKLKLDRFEKKLKRGGMPGLCFLRDESEFSLSCDVWLETTCFRDLAQVQGKPKSFEGSLALDILSAAARSTEPTVTQIAKLVRKDSRAVQRYLDAFCVIFVLKKLDSHPAGIGKPHYLLCDSGLAYHLGASAETALRAHLLTEILSKIENYGLGHPKIMYYRNEKTSHIPIVLEWPITRHSPDSIALQFYDGESPGRGDFESLLAFKKRLEKPKIRLLLLTQTTQSYKEKDVEVYPLRG